MQPICCHLFCFLNLVYGENNNGNICAWTLTIMVSKYKKILILIYKEMLEFSWNIFGGYILRNELCKSMCDVKYYAEYDLPLIKNCL